MSSFSKENIKDFFSENSENDALGDKMKDARDSSFFAEKPENKENGGTSALEALKRRMMTQNEKTVSQTAVSESKNVVNATEITDRIENETVVKAVRSESENDKLSPINEKNASERDEIVSEKTLLERCRPFIIDENGEDTTKEKKRAYKLETVAEILKANSEDTLERLKKDYDISFDDLGKGIYETDLSSDDENDADETPSDKPQPQPQAEREEIKEDFSKRSDTITFLSDLDFEPEETRSRHIPVSNTATIKFTPVTDAADKAHISVSSLTKTVDLSGELKEYLSDEEAERESEIQLELSEFDEYEPKDEYKSEKDGGRIGRKLLIMKKNSFLKTVGSVFLTLVLLLFKMPFMNSAVLSFSTAFMIASTAIFALIVLINADMFLNFSKIFTKHSGSDISAGLVSVTVLIYSVFGIIKNENILDTVLLAAVLLTVRIICRLLKDSYLASNFKQISTKTPKRGIELISDPATTFAMAKNSIEGDVLVAAPRKTAHIDGYMKYSEYGTFLGGKMPVITAVSILLSLIIGFSFAAYFENAVYGFFGAAAVQCIACSPLIFMIDNLPLFSAAKKLNKIGSMIAGKTGAEFLESANALVLNSEDIFPSGTVTLHHMQVLEDNNVDDTLIRAAALSQALDSPICPVIKKIVGTGGNVTLPHSDSVKYEDRMGISGWVDNRLLFVGNRTLMEAHGIRVPSVETDRKILRQGFFPIYVASEDKACVLIVVQYNARPDVAEELRRVSALGVTMLINNSDPNLTEEMICDYMGLYDDSVKVMTNAGCHMYKNAVTYTEKMAAPAAYKGNPIGLAAIIGAANRIKKSNTILIALYVITAVLGTVLFTYMSFDGGGFVIGGIAVLLYNLISTFIAYLLFLTSKP